MISSELIKIFASPARPHLNVALRDWLFNRVRISAYRIGPEYLGDTLRQIFTHKPTHFLGYPSAIYEFCVLLKERRINLHKLERKVETTWLQVTGQQAEGEAMLTRCARDA